MEDTPKKPTSSCGECTVCCSLLEVDVPGGLKPAYTPCRWLHAPDSKLHGCSIYDERPLVCQRFECHYIKLKRRPDLTTPTSLRPDQSGVMIVHMANRLFFTAYVDPTRPDAWRETEPPVHAVLCQLVNEGYRVIISNGGPNRILLTRDEDDNIVERPLPPEPKPEADNEQETASTS